MASFDRERLLRLIVTLNVDEPSRARLIAQLNRIQDRWSATAKRRAETNLQSSITQSRFDHRLATQRTKLEAESKVAQQKLEKLVTSQMDKVKKQNIADAASSDKKLNSQRSREFVRSQREQQRIGTRDVTRLERDRTKVEEQRRRAGQSLDAQRSRAYIQSQTARRRHEARERVQAEREIIRQERKKEKDETARLRTSHQLRLRRERDANTEMRKMATARDSLDKQRSRAYTRSQDVRHRAEMRNLRERDRKEDSIMRKGTRHLRVGALAAGAAVAGTFYAFQKLLDVRGREAIQLRGTSDALGIPLKDLQQLIYVARIMGLYFGPAELADAQNKMIVIQREMRRHKAGTLPYDKLNIGAQKLVEYGVDPEDATMGNMLPIIELMAKGWASGDREVMAALNNMFEEQVGKRVGVISTMMATGEWQKMLAVDLLTAEEIDNISLMYRQMILVIHELEVAMQRFLIGHKEDIHSFMGDLRGIVHVAGELLDLFSKLNLMGPILSNIAPIIVGIGAAMIAFAAVTWGAAWAAAALSAATGQWQNLAAFAVVGIAAGIFTRMALDRISPMAEVDPPATQDNQLKTISAVKEANERVEGSLDNILCIARNAQTDAAAATAAVDDNIPTHIKDLATIGYPLRDTLSMEAFQERYNLDDTRRLVSPPTSRYWRRSYLTGPPEMPNYMTEGQAKLREQWPQGIPQYPEGAPNPLKSSWNTPGVIKPFKYPRDTTIPPFEYLWSTPGAIDPFMYPDSMQDAVKQLDESGTNGSSNDSPNQYPGPDPIPVGDMAYRYSGPAVEVLGDMNINVEAITDIDEAVRETEDYLKSTE